MTTRIVRSEDERRGLIRLIEARKLPMTVNIRAGADRSLEQNTMAFRIFKDAADQLGDRTVNEVRAWAKLEIGVPILRAANGLFRERYDKIVRPLSYEDRLAMMVEPIDLPVTRMMKVREMTEFLDTLIQRLAEQGIVLRETRYE